MNILLVYPQYPDTFWSFKHVLGFLSCKAAFPPLGLLTVASLLPEDWSKKLVDTNVTALTDEQIAWADMVFVGAMLVQMPDAQATIDRCKALGKTVVVGGPAATAQPEAFERVDHFVLNEAEVTLPLFLADLAEGKAKEVYTSGERADITRTPVPLWSLVDLKQYALMPVQYCRGCPFNCEFCDIVVMYGHKPRTKTTEQCLDEMQVLYDAGWRGDVFIVDDNFIGNRIKVKAMLERLADWQQEHGYPFTFTTEASTDLADDEALLNLMGRANFNKVFLGIETPNEESLEECGKSQNTGRDLGEAVVHIQRAGLEVMGGFVVGFDSDTTSIFDAQIAFIQKTGVVTAMMNVLYALPGTRLWERLEREGRLYEGIASQQGGADLNFAPTMGHQALLSGYRDMVRTLYTPRLYYERIDTFLSQYRPLAKEHFSWVEVKAALRSMWQVGVLSKARWYYWRLLLRTSLRRFKSLPTAIHMAVCGLHFEKVSGEM